METIFKSCLMSPSFPYMMGIADLYVINSFIYIIPQNLFLGDIWLVSQLSGIIK